MGSKVLATLRWRERLPVALRGVRREVWLRAVVAAGVLGIILAAALLREQLRALPAVTYPGIFLLTFLGSASILVPIPGLVTVCGGALLGLSPVLVGVIAGTGEALGELTGYGAGFAGRVLIERSPLAARFSQWFRRRGGIILFVASLVPNPFFDIIGITAGSLRYPLVRFLPIVFLGKTLKDLGIVYACALGLEPLLRFLRDLLF